MQACGYKFRETVQIADRQIQIYEKPLNPEYITTTEQPPDSLQQDIADLLITLNRRMVLVDGFDRDHDARRAWAEKLKQQNPSNKAIYDELL